MKKYIFTLFFILPVLSYADDEENFFLIAKVLSERNVEIKTTLHSYIKQADKEITLDSEDQFKYLLTAGEAAAICALLSGNILGGAGFLSGAKREEYLKISKNAISECKSYITFKRRDLNAIATGEKISILNKLATDLVGQFDLLEQELDMPAY